MCHYIDVTKIVDALPENITYGVHSPNHYRHPEITIRFPICAASEEQLEPGETKIVQSCTILNNIPESHYVEFQGNVTNIGVYSISGVLNISFSGFFYATTHNSSIQSQIIPAGTHLGSVFIKQFYDTFDLR